MKTRDKNAANSALNLVLIYLLTAGCGLLLLPLINRNVSFSSFNLTHLMQDIFFLLLSAALLFFLIYRLVAQQISLKRNAVKNEKRYRSLFDNMHEGGAMYRPIENGQDFLIVDINSKGEQLDRINRHDFIGRRLSSLATEKDGALLDKVIRRVYATGNSEHYPISRYQDQQLTSWRDTFVFRLDTGEIVTLSEDVTEKKQLEHKLQQSSCELSLQNSIITRFLTADDDTVYQHILKDITQTLKSRFGVFGYLTDNDELLCTLLHTGPLEHCKMLRKEIIASPLFSDILFEKALQHGTTIIENRCVRFPVDNLSFNNYLAVPVCRQDTVIGIICIGDRDNGYNSDDITLLKNICTITAPILQSRLLAQRNEKLHFEASFKLVKNESRLKEAEKVAGIGHWKHDLIADTLSWSDEVYRIFGIDPKDFTPSIEKFLKLIHPDDKEQVQNAYVKALEEKTAYEISHRILLIDGTVKTVHERCVITYNSHGKAIRSLGTIQDITERVQIDKSYKRLATAIDQVVDVIVITDTNGIIQYVNPAFEKLTGYTKQEANGLNPRVLKSGEHSDAFYRELWDTICSGKVWHGQLTNKTKSGELFTEVASITPVKDDQGQIINFVAVKHDITRELELEQQLRQAVKMESIGTLAGGIAHDFNNILAAILGFTRMAMDDLPKDSQPYQDLSQVLQSGDRAVDLIKQILLFSRPLEEGFIPVKIQFLIKEAIKMLRASLPASITIKESIDKDCPPVMADPTQIHQVLMNLSTNAKHAMLSEGGTLSIKLSQRDILEEDKKRVTGLPSGKYVQLIIKDTGSGIPKKDLTRIFDPFFSTKAKGKGTGLGLAVAHGIVKSHHGVITVKSEPQQGTLFTIYLPVVPEKNTPVLQKDEAILSQRDAHLLVVDDELNILNLWERELTKLGYRVSTFHSSFEALASFIETPLQYDLLLTDMTMPDMNGRILAEKILALRPNLPVIMCTGHSELINEEQALECGVTSFLHKPIDPKLLAETLQKALN